MTSALMPCRMPIACTLWAARPRMIWTIAKMGTASANRTRRLPSRAARASSRRMIALRKIR